MMDESKPLSPPVYFETLDAPRSVPRGSRAAWLFLALGYFFCCAFPMSKRPLLAVFFLISLYALSYVFLLRGNAHLGLVQKLVLLSAALALLPPLLWADTGNAFLCILYALTAYCYLLYASTGNCLEEGMSAFVGTDLFRALVVFPLSSFGKLFPSLAAHGKKGVGKLLLKILLGLLLAVLPTAAALSLLSYDSGFRSIVDELFRFSREDLFIQLARLLFTLPVAMYFFGLYASSVLRSAERDGAAEKARERAERRHFVPIVTAAAAVIPLLLVYIIFFVSQWAYYTSAFTGVLPAHLSYAEYAREGFFQLCAVSCINFIVVICLSCYVKREGEGVRRTLCVILSVFTLVLIATAVSKLLLYIHRYGLTPDRVYAAWFMLLLAILFMIVLLSQFIPRLKALPLCLAVTVALYLLLALSGPNRLIARYNVDRFLSGQTQEIDVYLLSSLGDDAIPEMLRLERSWKENAAPRDGLMRKALHSALESRAAWETDFWRETLSTRRADRLLEEAGYTGSESYSRQ